MMSDPGFMQAPSGLIVPNATLDKTRRTLLNSDFVKLWRLMKTGWENKLLVSYHCATCKGKVRRFSRNRIVDDAPGAETMTGEISLSCECTTWTVRR